MAAFCPWRPLPVPAPTGFTCRHIQTVRFGACSPPKMTLGVGWGGCGARVHGPGARRLPRATDVGGCNQVRPQRNVRIRLQPRPPYHGLHRLHVHTPGPFVRLAGGWTRNVDSGLLVGHMWRAISWVTVECRRHCSRLQPSAPAAPTPRADRLHVQAFP